MHTTNQTQNDQSPGAIVRRNRGKYYVVEVKQVFESKKDLINHVKTNNVAPESLTIIRGTQAHLGTEQRTEIVLN